MASQKNEPPRSSIIYLAVCPYIFFFDIVSKPRIAVVLAPFFVHLEILFELGYRPAMHKRIKNEIGKEIAKIKKAKGDEKRAAGKQS
jgi:Predicted membrane protein